MNLGVDIGGTFTDLVAYDAEGERTVVAKVLNEGSGPQRDLLAALAQAGIPSEDVEHMRHGTTVVTNLLIERDGAKVGLIATRGFRDVLEIRRSYRERSLDLDYRKSAPLVPRHLRLEVGGRIQASGAESEALPEAEVEAAVRELVAQGAESLTVSLHNAYADPRHEQRVGEIARRIAPQLPITLSTDVDRRIGEYERVSTAVLNAMAVPTMQAYVGDLARTLRNPIAYMHSAGGVIPAEEASERPIQLALSGPAGGVLAGREVARALGFANAITMDMGGTSCDVSLIWNDEFRYRAELEVEWDVPARVRAVDVNAVGAGGGSLGWVDAGGALQVGPRSAGAVPGPACYGRGGAEATVTDANLVLGILSPEGLLGGALPLDADAAHGALAALGERLGVSAEEAARGMFSIVSANMAQAIREITVRRGIDPRGSLLIAFGGAGAQHAAAVAAQMGIRHIAIPAHGSVLSAVGLLSADTRITSARTVLGPLGLIGSDELERVFQELAREASERIVAGDGEVVAERSVGLRYVGQSHEVAAPYDENPATIEQAFEDAHERLFGTRLGDPIEIVECWVTLTQPSSLPAGRSTGEDVRLDGAGATASRRLLL
ncbi:MAG: N-methylhydantoinase, partial [Gaiellales bacterium]|nr:N-methylhydantoinase [Gaiellales bacterium]